MAKRGGNSAKGKRRGGGAVEAGAGASVGESALQVLLEVALRPATAGSDMSPAQLRARAAIAAGRGRHAARRASGLDDLGVGMVALVMLRAQMAKPQAA